MPLKHFSFLFLCIPALILCSCAGQVAPGGGPIDTTPPVLIHTEPDTNAVRVQTDKVVLEFSEYVDRRSVEESIFLSPYLGRLEFDWSGREVTITWSEKLRSNRTYVLNIGTDVIDVRARNRMANGFTLAFSTGDSIDRGIIRGHVANDKPEGIMMFAYSLTSINADTLDPSRVHPDYIMQTGRDGSFTLSNLAWGSYRVFAVRDEYKNLIYDKQVDEIGVTTHDVMISERNPEASELWFRLSREDTSKPFLTKVEVVNRKQLLLRFSEAIDSASFMRSNISLRDTTGGPPIGIQLRSLDRLDSTIAIVITSVPVDSGKEYRLSIDSLSDLVGNPLNRANASYTFEGLAIQDSVRPRLEVVGMRDSVRNIPIDESIEIRFTKPVQHDPLFSSMTLTDSLKSKISFDQRWVNASSVILTPREPLWQRAWYTLRVRLDSVKDYSGNRYKDSTYTIRFQTFDLRTTGTIEGTVVDPDTSKNAGVIFLSAKKIQSAAPFERTMKLKSPGKFKFEQVPEGQYTLSAFRDRDSSQSYSFGKPFPYQTSERFTVYADTIKVRARWSVEGVTVTFNKPGGK